MSFDYDGIELLTVCRDMARTGELVAIDGRYVPGGTIEEAWASDPKLARSLLDELLCAPHADVGLESLLQSGVISVLLPELLEIKGLGDDPISALHKDVWEHTKGVVMGTPNRPELRWGALMHDVGKARTRRVVRGKVSFNNHDVVGARMLSVLNQRVGLFAHDVGLFDTVHMLVLNHLRPANYSKTWGDSGVRRLLADVGGFENFERLMLLSRADLTTKNPKKRDAAVRRGNELVSRVQEVWLADTAPKLPKGTMGAVLLKVAVKPGAWCNAVRDELEDMMKAGILPSGESVEFYVAAALKLVEEKAYA
jgi:poly(A) polymerase